MAGDLALVRMGSKDDGGMYLYNIGQGVSSFVERWGGEGFERLEGTSELFRQIEFSRNQVLGPPFSRLR